MNETNENVSAVLETLGEKIRALKNELAMREWEVGTLKEKNKELYERLEQTEAELKKACAELAYVTQPKEVRRG